LTRLNSFHLDVDAQINKLKASFLNIENQIKEIRLKALSNKELSIQEVKRDMIVKKSVETKRVFKKVE
jgi:hypothetical protein